MKRISIILLSVALLYGCSEKSGDAGSYIYRRSFAMMFSETNSIGLIEEFHSPTESEIRFGIYLDMSSSCMYSDTGEKKEQYDALCEKYGDMTYNRKDFIYYGGDNMPSFQMYSFVSVEITSDADYDDLHPAGSSLADLFIFESTSAKPFVDSGYEMYEYVWWIDGQTYETPLYPVRKKASELTEYDLMLLCTDREDIAGKLEFESYPTLSKTHTFTVTFTDERGETFSDSLQMTFE